MNHLRRELVSLLSVSGALSVFPVMTFAQSNATGVRPPRADQVMWGGMGYSVPNADVSRYSQWFQLHSLGSAARGN